MYSTEFGYLRQGNKFVHVLVVEAALGKPLPHGAVVHHVNGVRTDNRPANLVACQNAAYHMHIHARLDALLGCGNPKHRCCRLCGVWAAPESLRAKSGAFYHFECWKEYEARYRRHRGIPSREAVVAKAHQAPTCVRGHPWTEENTYWRANRKARICRACGRERRKRRLVSRWLSTPDLPQK